MELKIINTKKQCQEYLDWVDRMFDQKIKPGTPEGEKLKVVLLLIKQYEDINYQVPLTNAINSIKIRMVEQGLKNNDLAGKVGSKGYIFALLNKTQATNFTTCQIISR